MTKKFWADWQKRIGETKAIVFNNGWLHFYSLFGSQNEFLEKLSFEGDYVTIDWNYEYRNLHNHLIRERRTRTVHRTEIKTVLFFQY